MGHGKIPTGWTNYTNFGNQLSGTKFIPLKTPLKITLTKDRLPHEQWFTPQDVLEQLPRLKLIINLTMPQSGRYYNYEELENSGVKVVQIFCQGKGTLPGKKQLKAFHKAVDDFGRDEAAHPDGLIGVHCTHGLNRTGYFICKYLVDRKNMAPNAAIELFEDARGHQMERHQYLNDLRSSANWRVSGGRGDLYTGISSSRGSSSRSPVRNEETGYHRPAKARRHTINNNYPGTSDYRTRSFTSQHTYDPELPDAHTSQRPDWMRSGSSGWNTSAWRTQGRPSSNQSSSDRT